MPNGENPVNVDKRDPKDDFSLIQKAFETSLNKEGNNLWFHRQVLDHRYCYAKILPDYGGDDGIMSSTIYEEMVFNSRDYKNLKWVIWQHDRGVKFFFEYNLTTDSYENKLKSIFLIRRGGETKIMFKDEVVVYLERKSMPSIFLSSSGIVSHEEETKGIVPLVIKESYTKKGLEEMIIKQDQTFKLQAN